MAFQYFFFAMNKIQKLQRGKGNEAMATKQFVTI